MSLKDLVSHTRPLNVSFEFSPPKSEQAEESLWQAIRAIRN